MQGKGRNEDHTRRRASRQPKNAFQAGARRGPFCVALLRCSGMGFERGMGCERGMGSERCVHTHLRAQVLNTFRTHSGQSQLSVFSYIQRSGGGEGV